MTSWRIVVDDRQFRASMTRLARDITREANTEANKIGQRFESHLSGNVDVLSGDLQGSIRKRDASSGDKVSVEVQLGDANTYYARWWEFGHANRGGGFTQGARVFYPLAARYNRLFKAALRRGMKRVYSRFNT